MIALTKLKIYKQYRADLDHYTRSNLCDDNPIITSDDFFMIDSLLQDIETVEKGLCSDTYKGALSKTLIQVCENDETIHELRVMAKSDNSGMLRADYGGSMD